MWISCKITGKVTKTRKSFSSLVGYFCSAWLIFLSMWKLAWEDGFCLLYQDTPVRRWSLAGILGWGRGEGWGPWHICDGRTISSRGVWRRGVGPGAADGRPGISRARGHTQVTSGARAAAVASMR